MQIGDLLAKWGAQQVYPRKGGEIFFSLPSRVSRVARQPLLKLP